LSRKIKKTKAATAKAAKTKAAAARASRPGSAGATAPASPVAFDASKIRAVLFDADNTLFPTRDAARECDREALRLFADEGADYKQVLVAFYALAERLSNSEADYRKRSRKHSYSLLAKKFGVRPQVADDAAKKFCELLLSRLSPYPAARRFIEKLRKKYSARLAVVTCEEREWALEKLEATGLMDFFDAIVTASETGRVKPHSSYYALACKALKARPQACAVVGDSEEHDLSPARRLGMHAFAADYEKLDGLFP
jgi:HAD superfamily hydrolase (TIGR01509 family)